MGSQKRQSDTSIRENLFQRFYEFFFFQAVHLLESFLPEKKRLGQTLVPGEEAVRFSVQPGLAFPPSEISNLEHGDGGGPANMKVAFMGLIGPSGVLPHWYTELAIERGYKKDHSLAAFCDVFHHRLISLFYLAWKRHRPTINYLPGAKDRVSFYLLSLLGLGTPGLTGMIGLPEESLLFYSGLLSRSVPSAVAIERAVEYFSGTTAKVQQFIDRMLLLSPEDQTQLGLANGQLGIDTICGSYVWESQTKFRVNLGPVGYDDFLRFLPTGDLFQPIFSLVRCMVGIEYEFEIGLFLRREEVPPCVIGMEAPAPPWLGWSTWIKTPGTTPRDDPYITFQEPEPF